jgi:hypothetical protein
MILMKPGHEEHAMLTTLSILSLDQGKLDRRPTSDEDYFARFPEASPPKAEPRPWYSLRFDWPLFGKQRGGEQV